MTSVELALTVALIALCGVVVGALITGLFLLVNGRLQSSRDHEKWLRLERVSFLASYLALVDESARLGEEGSARKAISLLPEVQKAASGIALFGPEELRELGRSLGDALVKHVNHPSDKNFEDDYDVTREAFITAARKTTKLV